MEFTISYPELAFVRFEVWDSDPIGRDFIAQRTVALNSIASGESELFSVVVITFVSILSSLFVSLTFIFFAMDYAVLRVPFFQLGYRHIT